MTKRSEQFYYWIYKSFDSEFPGIFTGLPIGMFVNDIYGNFNSYFIVATFSLVLSFVFNWLTIRLKKRVKTQFEWQVNKAKAEAAKELTGLKSKPALVAAAIEFFSDRKKIRTQLVVFPALWVLLLGGSIVLIFLGNKANTAAAAADAKYNNRELDTLTNDHKADETRIERLLIDTSKLDDSIKKLNSRIAAHRPAVDKLRKKPPL